VMRITDKQLIKFELLQTDGISVSKEQSELTLILLQKTIFCPVVYINNEPLLQAEDVKYLGIHLDKRLTCHKHIFTMRKQSRNSTGYSDVGPSST
jgi:hypothetical protein